MRIGILALQGAYDAHRKVIDALGHETSLIRTPPEMEGISGLIVPGGESTTIWMMLESSGLLGPVREWAAGERPVLGTCAGAILCTRQIEGTEQPTLGLADVGVIRNAYGRQRESFEAMLQVPSLGEAPMPGVFIRAPKFTRLGPGVESLCEHDGAVVLVKAGKMLLAAFHPELTDDPRLHQAFLHLCKKR